jgi:hypothetical protein
MTPGLQWFVPPGKYYPMLLYHRYYVESTLLLLLLLLLYLFYCFFITARIGSCVYVISYTPNNNNLAITIAIAIFNDMHAIMSHSLCIYAMLCYIIPIQRYIHEKYGGIVPNLAMQAHAANIDSAVTQALADAGVGMKDVGAVGVSQGPGLAVCLRIGLRKAQVGAVLCCHVC